MKYQVLRPKNVIIAFVLICTIVFVNQSFAAEKKYKLILLPMKSENVETFEKAIFQNVLKRELACKFKLFRENRVKAKLKQLSEKICITDDCLQKITDLFDCNLVAIGSVTYAEGGYTIGVEIKNVFTDEELFSEMVVCSDGNKVKVIKKMQLSQAISKMNLLAKRVCDATMNLSESTNYRPAPKVTSSKPSKPKVAAAIFPKKPKKKKKETKNAAGLVVDYTPVDFFDNEMLYTFFGVKYNYIKPEIGIFSCELLTGESSDSFYFGGTTVRQVDGGNAIKLRAGYDYPFLGGKGGIDFVAGGGIEYLDLSLDVVNAGSASVTKTCIYADAGVMYIAEKFIADFKLRLMAGEDTPDYLYGLSMSAGFRF